MAGSSTRRSGTTLAVVLLFVLAVAAAFALWRLGTPGAPEMWAAMRSAAENGRASAALASAAATGLLPWLLIPMLGPIAVACVLLLTGRSAATVEDTATDKVVAEAKPAAKPSEAKPAPKRSDEKAAPKRGDVARPSESSEPAGSGGLKLLATLQEEARLLDFVREDIAGYSDEQVGAAVRGIHAALRKAIDDRLEIEPILAGDEGDPVEVPAAMPPGYLRLSGRAVASPPFRGVLRHGGWRATAVRLPTATPGSDPSVLAPAEVEVGEE